MKRIQCRVCKEFMDFKEDWVCSEACRETAKKRDEETVRILNQVNQRNELGRAERKRIKEEGKSRRKEKKFRKRTEKALALQAKVSKQTKRIRALKQGKARANEFYETRGWQELRYRVLRFWGRKCMCCGSMDCELHVDHIKPRSRFPELALSFDNLQVLCRSCNLGKSNLDDKDWRPSA